MEETKQLMKLVKLLRAQTKPTVTLLLVGGSDVNGNLLIPLMYMATETSSNKKSMLSNSYCIFSSGIPPTGSWIIHEEDMKKASQLYSLAYLQQWWTTHCSRVVTLLPQH